ncbi:MAG: hypothetical protein IBJ16_06995 [Chitinophagaceae bacterium]|nr:hypothetical protein [Chitinophagaceae bacterium]
MKMKYVVAICLFIMLLSGCIHYETDRVRHGRVSITVKESDRQLRVDARFKRSQTDDVARIIKEELDGSSYNENNHSTTLTIRDDDKLFLRLKKGRLKIRFDKDENDQVAYDRVKRIADQVKIILTSDQAQR